MSERQIPKRFTRSTLKQRLDLIEHCGGDEYLHMTRAELDELAQHEAKLIRYLLRAWRAK